jgi:hypothetical protein
MRVELAPELLTSALRRHRDAGLWARYPEVSREGFMKASSLGASSPGSTLTPAWTKPCTNRYSLARVLGREDVRHDHSRRRRGHA